MPFISDGKSVYVTAPDAGVEKDEAFVADGWAGIAMADGSSGETIAMAVDQREYSLNVGGLTADKGDILYIDTAGALSTTNTDTPFAKVTVAKDSNSIAWVKLLENRTEIA